MSFLTGSRVYGKPREGSDIDLVVKLTKDEIIALERVSGESEESVAETEEYAGSDGFRRSIRFGDLNLICVECPREFRVWEKGTAALKSRAPVSRDEAIAEFSERRISEPHLPPLLREKVAAAGFDVYHVSTGDEPKGPVVNIRLNSTMFELAEPDAMRLAEMIRFHANEAAEAILAGKGE